MREKQLAVLEKAREVGAAKSKATKGLAKRGRVTQPVKRMWRDALSVEDREVEQYIPREIDLCIAELILAGHTSIAAMARECAGEFTTRQLSEQLQDPVVAAWISRQINAHVSARLGVVSAAMYAQACAGNVAAAELCFKRFGQLINRSQVVVHKGIDYSKLTDRDLDAVLAEKLKTSGTIIDITVNSRGEGSSAESSGGASAAQVEGPAAVLQAYGETARVRRPTPDRDEAVRDVPGG